MEECPSHVPISKKLKNSMLFFFFLFLFAFLVRNLLSYMMCLLLCAGVRRGVPQLPRNPFNGRHRRVFHPSRGNAPCRLGTRLEVSTRYLDTVTYCKRYPSLIRRSLGPTYSAAPILV